MLTYDELRNDERINEYIRSADATLDSMGYTDHSFSHIDIVANQTAYILSALSFDEHVVELGKIAACLHDIGNLVNRKEHALTGAVMAFDLLNGYGMPAEDVATVVSAIGNHDESVGIPVNPVAAALILADKSDVRRSRVRKEDFAEGDIHDRVNYSVKESVLKINEAKTIIKLKLTVDTRYGSVMDYFQIFLSRMSLCKAAAEKLGLQFKLIINERQLI
ncbi:MAG: HD domain-containing protein [Clostridia bacterium]|nr:HD domain-containing protein [Clostridia bacterium]